MELARKPIFYVVDDDPVTRLMLCRFLEKNGYLTMGFANGAVANEAFDQHLPDVVLMDAKMPVMDGFDACRLMKARPDARHIPVIMITGLNDDESVDRAFEAGAVDFITKPIHWAILRNRVHYLLTNIEAQRNLSLASRVYDNTGEGIVVTDPYGMILSVNPAFTRITGFEAFEAVGRNMNMLKSGRHGGDFYLKLWQALSHEGRWQGEFYNRRKDGSIFPQWSNISAIHSPTGRIENYISVFSDLTAIKESEENLLFVTGHDALTGLPNRHLFHERLGFALEEAAHAGEMVWVLLLDLDRFKVVNETMGHDVGDTLILEVSRRLASLSHVKGSLGRLGGDEFGVIIASAGESQIAAQTAQAMLDVLKTPFMLRDMEYFVGASIGIGVYPLDGADAKTLMQNIDAALYHAKERGRNNFQFYRNEMNTRAMNLIRMETSLRVALEKDEFELYFQPQMHLSSGRLAGVEALIRWNRPGLGMVSPGEFIPVAEETGLIIPMGLWALTDACQRAFSWISAGHAPFRVAVNLSGIQFEQPDFVNLVTQTLKASGLDHQWLELELTESIAMGDVEETLIKLKSLSSVGVALAIDDFGTGFSSLKYLKRFPIDTLKIDQSFVRNCAEDVEDAAIIRAFIGLAHSLGLSVIAEGVETEEQLEFLKSHGCDEIQGYIYSRPLSEAALMEFLRSHRG
nr:Response regulator receiver modulated diguanylate cyclase/phosphodiesterase with PAS/PAC sensor(S) [uncultured bacterium]